MLRTKWLCLRFIDLAKLPFHRYVGTTTAKLAKLPPIQRALRRQHHLKRVTDAATRELSEARLGEFAGIISKRLFEQHKLHKHTVNECGEAQNILQQVTRVFLRKVMDIKKSGQSILQKRLYQQYLHGILSTALLDKIPATQRMQESAKLWRSTMHLINATAKEERTKRQLIESMQIVEALNNAKGTEEKKTPKAPARIHHKRSSTEASTKNEAIERAENAKKLEAAVLDARRSAEALAAEKIASAKAEADEAIRKAEADRANAEKASGELKAARLELEQQLAAAKSESDRLSSDERAENAKKLEAAVLDARRSAEALAAEKIASAKAEADEAIRKAEADRANAEKASGELKAARLELEQQLAAAKKSRGESAGCEVESRGGRVRKAEADRLTSV